MINNKVSDTIKNQTINFNKSTKVNLNFQCSHLINQGPVVSVCVYVSIFSVFITICVCATLSLSLDGDLIVFAKRSTT